MRTIALLPAFLWAGAGTASELLAQETIASDRPGIGSGSFVVGPGTIQVEAGFEIADTGARDYSFGQALVRIGLPGVELEVLANSVTMTDNATSSVSIDDWGIEDTGFGVKVPLVRDTGGGMALSLQGIATAPTGSEGFTNGEWVAALNGLADLALGERASVSFNLGHEFGSDVRDGATSVIVTPGLSVGSGVGVYGGWAGTFFTNSDTAHVAEAGLTYLATPNVQLDLNGGRQVGGPRSSWFAGVGVAKRWGGR